MEPVNNLLDFEERPPEQDPELHLADTSLRFVHYLVDQIVLYLLAMLVGFLLVGADEIGMEDESDLVAILVVLIYPGYFIAMEYLAGQTIGKMLTGCYVVTKYGARPTFLNIVGRTLCRFIPFEPFSFLFSGPSGWHDTISDTRVVRRSFFQ